MDKTVIVRYGELALKSEPVRRRFERRLVFAIDTALNGLGYSIRRERGRIFVDTSSPGTIVKRLLTVPGIVSVSQATKVAASIHEIRNSSVRAAEKVLKRSMGFAVRTSRTGEHAFSSRDVNVDVGSAILSKVKGVHVNLSSPDREISVEVRGSYAYVFTETAEGVGGLPVGTQGGVVAIFSGNCNDFAAAYLMMKRGAAVFPLFPDPSPPSNKRALRSAITSAKKLSYFDPKLELRVFPIGKLLSNLKKKVTDGSAYIIYRRVALRVADIVGGRLGAEAIVAGDDANQISSQKLSNLSVMDEACRLPVLRPLAGLSGAELKRFNVKLPSREKGSCPFPPPEDTVNSGEIRKIEGSMDIETLINKIASDVKTVELR